MFKKYFGNTFLKPKRFVYQFPEAPQKSSDTLGLAPSEYQSRLRAAAKSQTEAKLGLESSFPKPEISEIKEQKVATEKAENEAREQAAAAVKKETRMKLRKLEIATSKNKAFINEVTDAVSRRSTDVKDFLSELTEPISIRRWTRGFAEVLGIKKSHAGAAVRVVQEILKTRSKSGDPEIKVDGKLGPVSAVALADYMGGVTYLSKLGDAGLDQQVAVEKKYERIRTKMVAKYEELLGKSPLPNGFDEIIISNSMHTINPAHISNGDYMLGRIYRMKEAKLISYQDYTRFLPSQDLQTRAKTYVENREKNNKNGYMGEQERYELAAKQKAAANGEYEPGLVDDVLSIPSVVGSAAVAATKKLSEVVEDSAPAVENDRSPNLEQFTKVADVFTGLFPDDEEAKNA